MYDYTSNNWSHQNSKKRIKEKCVSHTRRAFNRFTKKDSYTRNITHNTESNAIWNLKPKWWGSPVVQEKYQEEKACDKRRRQRQRQLLLQLVIIVITIMHYFCFIALHWRHHAQQLMLHLLAYPQFCPNVILVTVNL